LRVVVAVDDAAGHVSAGLDGYAECIGGQVGSLEEGGHLFGGQGATDPEALGAVAVQVL
jgi:hypothetical protein